MIQKPKNWDSVQEFSDRPKLPLDAYVCRVKQVSFADTNYGPQLLILFDIEEGEQSCLLYTSIRNRSVTLVLFSRY